VRGKNPRHPIFKLSSLPGTRYEDRSALDDQVAAVSHGKDLCGGKDVLTFHIGAHFFKILSYLSLGFCDDSKAHFQEVCGFLRRRCHLFGEELELFFQKTI
jgi:hypothetical protein